VLLIHHQRKSGGEHGDAVRDSNAIVGACDVLIELERVPDAGPQHRRLVAQGRWPQTPAEVLIEHDPKTASWQVIGAAKDRRHDRARLAHAPA
jgi:hypothetical protein